MRPSFVIYDHQRGIICAHNNGDKQISVKGVEKEMTRFRVRHYMTTTREQLAENEFVLVQDSADRRYRWLDIKHQILMPGAYLSRDEAIEWLHKPDNVVIEEVAYGA